MEKPKTRGQGAGSQTRRQDFSREAAAPPWTQGPGAPRAALSGAKRAFDLVLSLTALVFFLPVFLVVSIAVLLNARGSILVTQKKTGLGGGLIDVLAFRVFDARMGDAASRRFTAVGAFLRRTGLEDLPQFLNVAKGDLSLVGPEARSVVADAFYSRRIKDYGQRFRVKPGMTGLAQVTCPDHGDDAVAQTSRQLEFDNTYIETWSFSLDCKILLKALARAFSSGAKL